MQHLHARKFVRTLFLIAISCLSYTQSNADDCAALASQMEKLQAQLDTCCENVSLQGDFLETCCAELKDSINCLKSEFDCPASDCCSAKFLTCAEVCNNVKTADWSFDGKYIAVGLDLNNHSKGKFDTKVLKIYELVGCELVLKAQTAIGKEASEVSCVRWHPSKYRLALGRVDIDDSDEHHLHIIDFNPATCVLTEKDSAECVDVFAVAWRKLPFEIHDSSDEEDVLAVGRAACNGKFELTLYGVSVSGKLIGPVPKTGINTHGKISPKALDWDATSRFLAVGVEATNQNHALQVYEFIPKQCCLELNASTDVERCPGQPNSKSTVLCVSWNPECKNLLAVGVKGSSGELAQVFEHSHCKLHRKCGIADLCKSVHTIQWKDCNCLALGKSGSTNAGSTFRIYSFDKFSCSFTLETECNKCNHADVNEVRWSGNGKFVLNGSDANRISVYKTECKNIGFCDLVSKLESFQGKVNVIIDKIDNIKCNDSACETLNHKLDCVNESLCNKIRELECIILECCTAHDRPSDCCTTLLEVIESLFDNLDIKCTFSDIVCTVTCDNSTVLSKLDIIDVRLFTCCSVLEHLELLDCCSQVDAIDQHTNTILSKVCAIDVNLNECCFTLESKIDVLENCCSQVDAIDQHTNTILSKVCAIDVNLHECCFTLCSKIEAIDINEICDCVMPAIKCCFTVDSKIDILLSKVCNLDIPDCCSQVDAIDQHTNTILSKVCAIDVNLNECCFTLESKLDVLAPNCCSQVDAIDQHTNTILSKVCAIDVNLNECCFSICSKIEQIFIDIDNITCTVVQNITNNTTNITTGTLILECNTSLIEGCCFTLQSQVDRLANCCSQVDAIDQHTNTILSKVCAIDINLNECCFTVESKIDELTMPNCCSVVDVIDRTTQTILSKVCDIDIDVDNGFFSVCSKLEQLALDVNITLSVVQTNLCDRFIIISGPTVEITTPGSYKLCGDVFAAGALPAIRINASNVKLDLNQFSVQGDGVNHGIVFGPNAFEVEIFNGVIENLSSINVGDGIRAEFATNTNITIRDVVIRNWDRGIHLLRSSLININNATISDNNDGIRAETASELIYIKNVLSRRNFANGISLDTANSVYINDSVLSNNSAGAGIAAIGSAVLRVENTQLGENLFGALLNNIRCGEFINCHATLNVDGFQVTSGIGNAEVIFRDTVACDNIDNGYHLLNVECVYFFNCVAEDNGADGFRTDTATGSTFIQGCKAHCNRGIGFNEVMAGGNHHLYLANSACDNDLGNYSANVDLAVVRGPNNARGVQNVDCSITTTDEVPVILSKVCQIQQELTTCCSVIENLLMTTTNALCNLANQTRGSGVIAQGNNSNIQCGNIGSGSCALRFIQDDVRYDINAFAVQVTVPGDPAICIDPGIKNIEIFNGVIENITGLATDIGISITGGGNVNVYIHDVVIRTFTTGIHVRGANQIILERVQIYDCSEDAVVFDDTSDIQIRDCIFVNNARDGAQFNGSVFTGCRNINIDNSNITTNGRDGINLFNTANMTIGNCLANVNGRDGLHIRRCGGLRIENSVFSNNNNEGVFSDVLGCGSFLNCAAEGNLNDGFHFISSVGPLDFASTVLLRDCNTCGNFNNGFEVGRIQSIELLNCVAQANQSDGYLMAPESVGLNPDEGKVIIQNSKAIVNRNFGFEDQAIPLGANHHLYLADVACDNGTPFTAQTNYDPNITSQSLAVIRGPNDARGMQNIDCALTGTSEVVETCCSQVDAIDQHVNTILSKVCAIDVNLTECCFTLESKLDNIVTPTLIIDILDCCSQVDAIDRHTNTILSKVCAIDVNLNECCFTLESKLDLLEPSCCSQVDAIDRHTNTILSKVCAIDVNLNECCFTLESKLDALLTPTIIITIADCCSQVDAIDQHTNTILSKVCAIDINLNECCFTLESKIDSILTPTIIITIPDCCSQVDAIDQHTNTILSKVCAIDVNLNECCFTLESKLDNITVTDCCSQIDIIDHRTSTILSKVCLIQSELETCCAELNSKIDNLGCITNFESLQACCDALRTQLETCCDELITIDENILSKVCDIHKCVIDFDSCDEIVCLKDRVKTILKKICHIEDKLNCFSFSDSIRINRDYDVDDNFIAKIAHIDQRIDLIDKKMDTLHGGGNSRSHSITKGTLINSAGNYCVNANMPTQSIKIDIGASGSVILDLNGYVVDDIKLVNDKSATIKNLVIKNGKVVNISTEGKNICNNLALHLEHLSAQTLNLSKINNVSVTVSGYIDVLKLSGTDVIANLSNSIVRLIDVEAGCKDVSVQNARIVEGLHVLQNARNVMLTSIDVAADGSGGEITVEAAHNVCMDKVSARSITFSNGSRDCTIRRAKCAGGGFKVMECENITCIDCSSSQNGSGAGFSSQSSVASIFENCLAVENEDGFILSNDSHSSIVRSHAKRNKKCGFKDRDCIGCAVNESQALGNTTGFNHLGSSVKSLSNPTIYHMNYAAGNNANYSQLSANSAPIKLHTDAKSYGDNIAARLP